MKSNDSANTSQRSLFSNIIIVVLFMGMMAASVMYLSDSEPNVREQALRNFAQQFSRNVINAHWQWQAEGRPQMIMLVQYNPATGQEIGRKPIRMAANGYPHVDSRSDSCEKLWQGILYVEPQIDSFRVISEFYDDGVNALGEPQYRCRFRLSTGPYFDYYVNNGRVETDD